MVKKKTFLQKAISFVTSAVMVLTMGYAMPKQETVKAATTINVTGEEIASHFLGYVGQDYYVNKCLAFVAHGFEDMGATFSSACCAWKYSQSYLDSTSRDIPIGADVFFSSTGCDYNVTDSYGHDCGHIGVYVGDGYMVHAYSGEIVKMKISKVESHGYTYLGWGYHRYVNITEPSDYPKEGISGTYYLKNKSTGTYMHLEGSDANKANIGVAANDYSNAFKMVVTPIESGNPAMGHYIVPKGCTRAVNPYAQAPVSGTNVTLFDKTTDGQQYWIFEPVDGGYIIHNKWDQDLVLTTSGTNVIVSTNTGAASQIWTVESTDVKLSSIAINPDSIGTIYEDGSQMDTSALSLTAAYSDGSTKTITSGYSITAPSLADAGTQTLAVSYEGMTATLDITVQDLFEGSGTESDPYLIGTAEDLKNLANMVNTTAANPCYGTAYYQQTADIDLSQYDWTPIGIYFESASSTTYNKNAVFKGCYDGNYHKVTNLSVDYPNKYAGLFGRLNYGSKGAVIENLSVSGNVTSGLSSAGGIAGEAGYGAVIRNCDFTGTVNGTEYVGGITGKVHNGGTLENCYANAEVTATAGGAGGITGGVLAAGAGHSLDVVVENCYFTGKISGTTTGGISGTSELGTANDTTITFTNNYYLNSAASGAVAGAAQSGCMGLITSQLKTIAPDLGAPFADNPYSALNGGFPVFEWQLLIAGDVNTDGTVSVLDVVALQQHILAVSALYSDQCENADMDANGEVNAFDLALLKRCLLQNT